jgi:hypothetical protein
MTRLARDETLAVASLLSMVDGAIRRSDKMWRVMLNKSVWSVPRSAGGDFGDGELKKWIYEVA